MHAHASLCVLLSVPTQSDIVELSAAGFKVGMPTSTKTKSIAQAKAERQELLDVYRVCLSNVSLKGVGIHTQLAASGTSCWTCTVCASLT